MAMTFDDHLEIMYGPNCRNTLPPAIEEFYRHMAAALWSHLGGQGPCPQVEVVRSLFARPTVLDEASAPTIIYDHSLGTMFSRLTKLMLIFPEMRVRRAVLYHVVIERLINLGLFNVASLFVGLKGMTLEGVDFEESLTESEDLLNLRATLTSMQEAFAIAHELAHILYQRSQEVRDESETHLRLEMALIGVLAHSVSRLDDSDPVYGRLDQESRHHARESILDNFHSKEYYEELWCDFEAAKAVSRLSYGRPDVAKAWAGSYSALLNLNYLRILDEAITSGAQGIDSRQIRDLLLRPMFLQESGESFCRTHAESRHSARDLFYDTEEMHEFAVQKDMYDLIESHALSIFSKMKTKFDYDNVSREEIIVLFDLEPNYKDSFQEMITQLGRSAESVNPFEAPLFGSE